MQKQGKKGREKKWRKKIIELNQQNNITQYAHKTCDTQKWNENSIKYQSLRVQY